MLYKIIVYRNSKKSYVYFSEIEMAEKFLRDVQNSNVYTADEIIEEDNNPDYFECILNDIDTFYDVSYDEFLRKKEVSL